MKHPWRWAAVFAIFVLVVWLWARARAGAGGAPIYQAPAGGGSSAATGFADVQSTLTKLTGLGQQIKKTVDQKQVQMSFGMCGCGV
jgi:hypothetical protein